MLPAFTLPQSKEGLAANAAPTEKQKDKESSMALKQNTAFD
jgi:hypothetical protein